MQQFSVKKHKRQEKSKKGDFLNSTIPAGKKIQSKHNNFFHFKGSSNLLYIKQ